MVKKPLIIKTKPETPTDYCKRVGITKKEYLKLKQILEEILNNEKTS